MGPPNQRISNRSYELEILNMTRIFKLFLLDALLKLCMLRPGIPKKILDFNNTKRDGKVEKSAI